MLGVFMNKYKVEITEYLQKTIEVDAKDENEAYSKVKQMYDNEEIILSADDFTDKEIKVLED